MNTGKFLITGERAPNFKSKHYRAPPIEDIPLPDWLAESAAELELELAPRKPSEEARELLHVQYDIFFEHVIDRICHGDSLTGVINDSNKGFIYEDFWRWVKCDSKRYERYKEAQELRTGFLEHQIIKFAYAEDSVEDVQRSKLKVDTLRFLMSAWNRKRYSDTKTVEMVGSISITNILEAARARAGLIDNDVVDMESRDK